LTDIQLDDVLDFQKTDAAMSKCGINEVNRQAIYATAAAVMHVGNITFSPADDR
jgi:myosin heavy subunit